MQRDSIDFGTMNIPVLFRKMFFPTLLGMLLSATINVADGAFVGHGAGSDALAAVNIVAPFFLITTGIGLMFGAGVSIVASVHLSQKRYKAANINVTQAFTVALLLMLLITALVMLFPDAFARMMGCSDRLLPYVRDYMRWVIPSLPFGAMMCIGMFFLRLDGAPVFAAMCEAVPAVVNLVLDYVFVFPCGMGIEGASLATGIAQLTGALMVAFYMACRTKVLHFYRPKFTPKSLRLTMRNIGYQVRLGAPSLIGELAIACMMLVGNRMYLHYLHEDGVAAFSIACYCFPLVFMIGNAIAQSVQPIISYNHGAGLDDRVRQTLRLSVAVAFVCGLLTMLLTMIGREAIVGVFLSSDTAAYTIAAKGMPWFSLAFPFFSLNLVYIGYIQSLEDFRRATFYMLLRGVIFVVPAFVAMPWLLGTVGLWLAVPLSECLTLLCILPFIGKRAIGRRACHRGGN
ncbi:MAG: MATE family efflux transporter [Paludibacteraceae bacterium]